MSFNPWIHNIYEPVLSLFPEEYEVLRQYALQATREDHLTMAYLNAQTEKMTRFIAGINQPTCAINPAGGDVTPKATNITPVSQHLEIGTPAGRAVRPGAANTTGVPQPLGIKNPAGQGSRLTAANIARLPEPPGFANPADRDVALRAANLAQPQMPPESPNAGRECGLPTTDPVDLPDRLRYLRWLQENLR